MYWGTVSINVLGYHTMGWEDRSAAFTAFGKKVSVNAKGIGILISTVYP